MSSANQGRKRYRDLRRARAARKKAQANKSRVGKQKNQRKQQMRHGEDTKEKVGKPEDQLTGCSIVESKHVVDAEEIVSAGSFMGSSTFKSNTRKLELMPSDGKEIVDLWQYGQTQVGFVVKAPPPRPHCKLQYTGSFGVGYTCTVCGVHREWKKPTHCNSSSRAIKKNTTRLRSVSSTFPYNASCMVPEDTLYNNLWTPKPAPPKATYFQTLALELQQEIFKYLDFRTLCCMDQTCTDWYLASHDCTFAEDILMRDISLHKRLGLDLQTLVSSWGKWSLPLLSKGECLPALARTERTAFARFKCLTLTLHSEFPKRMIKYSSEDIRTNQSFRNKLDKYPLFWIEFLILELTKLSHIDAHRSNHRAFLLKLRFISNELTRRTRGRHLVSNKRLIIQLKDMQRRVQLAINVVKKPRLGEAKIRDLKCNWRK